MGTPTGVEAKTYMDNGDLVPDKVIIDLVVQRMQDRVVKRKGWLLDGFPRTAEQAKAMATAGLQVDHFVHIDVPDEILSDRVMGRRSDPVTGKIYHMTFNPPPAGEIADRCVQRSDDTEEKIKVRLKNFHGNITAVQEVFDDKLAKVNGNQKPDEVFDEVAVMLM